MSNYIKNQFSKLSANKAVFISIILSLFIPVLYGAILLTSKMHPTDHMDNLPVAVVNDDVGVMSDGEQLHVGNQLVDNLKASEALGWDFVDTSTAMEGLQNNDYYMVIVIPEEFSNNVLTLTEPDPKKLELSFIQNEGLSFNAATITDTAANTIKQELEKTIIHQFAETVVDQVGGGFEEAADGSEQLADGTDQLLEGTEQLNESVTGNIDDINRLASGSRELKDGTALILSNLRGNSGDINRLASGAQELHEGTETLGDGTGQILSGLQEAKSGSTQLYNGLTQQLAPGSERLAEGSVELAEGSEELAAGVEEAQAGVIETVESINLLYSVLQNLPASHETLEDDIIFNVMLGQLEENVNGADVKLERFQELVNGAHRLKAGASELKAGAHELRDGLTEQFKPGLEQIDDGLSQLVAGQSEVVAGVADLEDGAKQIADGNAGVRSGWNELTSGATELDAGAAQIAEGNAQVNEGWQELVEGSTELNEGAQQLNDGSHQLAEGLQSGLETISPMKQAENIEMFASPVEMAFEQINSPEYYRDTTAPLVTSLALFVGILITSLFMNFNRPADVSPLRWFVSRFVNLSILAIIQAVLLLVYLLLFIRMQATNPGLLILTLLVAAVTFSAVVLFLASLAGHVGRFIAIAFVLLQLQITGGDLPVIMLSDTLTSLSSYLPFYYSIAGIRTALMLGNSDQILFNILILLVFAVVALALTFIVYMFKKDNNMTSAEETEATPSSAF